ncbi:MAG TPA: hypothetical protein VF411_11605 [Bacteroidia bacterium]
MGTLVKAQHLNETNSALLVAVEKSILGIKVGILTAKKSSKKKSAYIKTILEKNIKGYTFKIEEPLSKELNDKADCVILDLKQQPLVIIEIDNMRADQVTKKLVSRLAMVAAHKNITYITICYKSKSAKGYKEECRKYINKHIPAFLKNYKTVEYMAFLPKDSVKENKPKTK